MPIDLDKLEREATDQVWRRGDSYPADWPEWLRSADIEWCQVEIAEGGKVVWHDGIWNDGAWLDGVWCDGIWYDGGWHGGEWRGGAWCDGIWYDGGWHGGEWHGGRWRYGVWHDGVWLDAEAWRTDGPPDDSIGETDMSETTETDAIEYPHHDMYLRDRLAAHVIQGLLANPSGPIQANGMCGWDFCNCTIEQVADLAWLIADHMLKARGGSNAD